MVSTPEYHQHVSGLQHRVAVRNDFFVSAEDEQYKTFGVEFTDGVSGTLPTGFDRLFRKESLRVFEGLRDQDGAVAGL